MKILVTGGAGFIGSAVIRHVLDNTRDSIVNLDALTYAGNLNTLSKACSNERYEFVHANICDRKSLKYVFTHHQPDAVMHLAAESHVDRSIDGPSVFIQTNLVGTFNLLEVARQYWCELEPKRRKVFRFHHISTDEVYGDLEDSEALFTESTSYNPSSPYSASKAGADHLVRAWSRTYGLPIVISNCSNNYGPYQCPEKLIPVTILNAIGGKPILVYGSGLQIRDWLYVEDHAEALYRILKRGKEGETYNVGGHNEKTNLEVVQTICRLLDEIEPMRTNASLQRRPALSLNEGYQSLIQHVEDRPGHDLRYAIDASKLTRELGWTPRENFASGIQKTVKWYLSNREWWLGVLDGTYALERLGRN